jgi:hypothetical protein
MTANLSRRVVILLALLASLAAGTIVAAQRSSSAMVAAAIRFLDGLSADERRQAAFAFATGDRVRWHYVPNFRRNGLPIKAMSEPQRKLAHDLLRAGLSQRGYLTYNGIMELEKILRVVENGRMIRDWEAYVFSIFGTPSTTGTWGWRVEGHHVSLHFTMVEGAVASSPSFAGANPAEVRSGPQRGQRLLAAQEDSARTLLMALDAAQRDTAIFDRRPPGDVVTGNRSEVDPLAPAGLKASAMTPAQRDLLMNVVESYTSIMADDIAAARLARVRGGGVEQVAFGWAGGVARGERHYYRVQGPTFLIEFDNTQGNGNHIHSVWRDFDGDFGRDLLREHVAASH